MVYFAKQAYFTVTPVITGVLEGHKQGHILENMLAEIPFGEWIKRQRKALGMTQQQIQRYERDGWQKISLWRLAEAADALGLDLSIRARLPASKIARSAGVG